MTTQHTPTPWKVCDIAVNDQWHVGSTIGAADPADGRRVCDVSRIPANYQANAAFIVRACNAHDALVAALKESQAALVAWKHSYEAQSGTLAYIDAQWKANNEALAQAEGRQP